jgi:hypothetical protein
MEVLQIYFRKIVLTNLIGYSVRFSDFEGII